MFSKYIQTEDLDALVKIQKILIDEDSKRKMPFLAPILASFELICSKMVRFLKINRSCHVLN